MFKLYIDFPQLVASEEDADLTFQGKEAKSVWVVKVSANDSVPLIYFPKEVREIFGIRKGDYLAISIDLAENQLLLKKLKLPKMTSQNRRISER